MPTEHQITPEERAFHHLRLEQREQLSETALTVLQGAYEVAYNANMMPSMSFGPPDADEIMEEVYPAAAELSDHECKQLTRIWCAALSAAASVDPDDYETLIHYRVYRADLHDFYRHFSGLVEGIVRKKRYAEIQKEVAERKPPDGEDIPF